MPQAARKTRAAGPAARVFLAAFGILLSLQLAAWAFGYRKAAAGES